ncbi:Histone-fold [Penicillium bovifimosum]|uniref:Histone-fold n=1 Tax=Penicillium bovifimosum TaxID=126998 RepID=A0A9W9L0J8_9EURO|nr:Histone-fold [Penicillium bovifimosum]KAJ5131253.1 Histone-fold [Penicillium bovifimosum]
MASPTQAQATVPTAQPLTPPAEATATTNGVSAPAAATSQTQPHTPATGPTTASQPPPVPGMSTQDSGKSRRPRDVRLVHMLLASLGVTSYQDRVPLQLLDFAYRYTANVLQDAVHLATEGYAAATDGTAGAKGSAEVGSVSLPALRLSIASRLHFQFQAGLPKEFLMDVASERNRIALPGVSRGFDPAAGAANGAAGAANQSVMMGGMRLPPERFCLTGKAWDMKDEWDSEGEGEEMPDVSQQPGAGRGVSGDAAEDNEGGDEDENDGKMEDIFGEDTTMGEAGDGDEDRKMTDV